MTQKEVILITGPAGNLGSALVNRFRAADFSLWLIDRHPDRLSRAFPELASSLSHLLMGGIDLLDSHAVQSAVDRGLEKLGRVDALVHTVGGFSMGDYLSDQYSQIWERMMDLNLKTLVHITRAVLPTMISQGRGKIVTVGARPSLQGRAHMSAYSAAKAAVLRLTESLSAEYKADGINVNCLIPGTIDTPENRRAMPDADRSRWVSPASLAEAAYFLCSSAAKDIHGAAVPVYGA